MDMIRAVIFDMDGLMFDTERLAKEAWIQVGQELGFQIDERVICQIRGATPAASAAVFEKEFGKAFNYPMAKQKRNLLVERRIDEEGIPVKKGLHNLLCYLKENGIFCAVATSSPENVLKKYLHQAEVEGYFDSLISSDQVRHSKPDPECFLMSAAALGVEPADCLVLEDSANGLRAAHNAGMQSICIPDLALPDQDALASAAGILRDLDEVITALNTYNLEIDYHR